MTRTPLPAAAVLVAALFLGSSGCGSSDDSTGDAATPSTTAYAPKIDPASFSTTIDNRYFPLVPGTVFVYDGTEDGERQRNDVTVTRDTKVVDGVRCVVVHDVVYVGGAISEDTFDWYAQDADGAVWYFGEDTKELDRDGTVTSTAGSWEAGVDGAQPGIVMPAVPTVGRTYRQEYRKGDAEDMATVLQTDASVTVPFGRYDHVLVTKDFTALEPDIVEHKRYAPGVGFVSSDLVQGGQEHVELVRVEHT
jgi:hypothetical protein